MEAEMEAKVFPQLALWPVEYICYTIRLFMSAPLTALHPLHPEYCTPYNGG